MGLIFLGSSLPGASVSGNKGLDFAAHKLVHLVEYAILFMLLWRSFPGTVPGKRFSYAFLLTIAFAVSDELHQLFVFGRDGRASDVIIDGISGLVGFFVVSYRAKLLRKLKVAEAE
jgi:VanZ family protein